MATADPAKNLQDEATCSICLDFFQDPVMLIECGHNFCRPCITKFCKGSDCSARCPECRHWFTWTNLKPNRQLGNIVEMAKQLSLQLKHSSQTGARCMEHQKALTLFCKTDETLICTVCDRSKTHRNHEVVHTDEAAADYKELLLTYLENLKKERNKIQSTKSNGEKPSQELLRQTQAKRQEIVSEFQQQRRFLEEQEQLQLSKLGDLEKEIERRRDDYASPFVDEISYITDLMGDMEKDKQPANEFLQNIGSILDRYKKRKFRYPAVRDSSDMKERLNQFCQESAPLQNSLRKFRENMLKPKWIKENVSLDPETAHPRCQRAQFQPPVKPDSSELRRKLQIFSKESASLQADLKKFQVSFPDFSPFIPLETRSQPKWMEVCFPDFSPFIPLETRSQPKWMEENVVLDRGTAHPRFVVSDDRKSVSWGSFRQEVPYSPKRFDPSRCVLGSRGFSSGRHHWTVDVEHGTFWAVGVAQASVQRKGQLQLVPEEGIWAVGLHNGQYKALTSPPDLLILDSHINKVQICLDYEGATVAFWDDEEGYELYCFRSANFEGQTLFPFFRVGDMRTTLSLC